MPIQVPSSFESFSPKPPSNDIGALKQIDKIFEDVTRIFGSKPVFEVIKRDAVPGSQMPESIFDIVVAKSQREMDKGKSFSFPLGFIGNKPFVYDTPTYAQSTPGFLPYNAASGDYWNFGSQKANVLNTSEHIAGLVHGVFWGSTTKEEGSWFNQHATPQEKWGTAKAHGVYLPGLNLKLPGLNVAVDPTMTSTNLIRKAMTGPVVQVQHTNPDIFNQEGTIEEQMLNDAESGRIRGLPRSPYGLYSIGSKEAHRFMPPEAVSHLNADGSWSTLALKRSGAANRFERETNEPIAWNGKVASLIPTNPGLRPPQAVIEAGETRHNQYVMRLAAPVISELAVQSGAGIVSAPTQTLDIARNLLGRNTVLAASRQSQMLVPIPGFKSPQDLFYTDKNGERQFSLDLDPRFAPKGLTKENVIEAGEVVGFGGLRRSGQNAGLTATTGERRFMVEGAMAVFPYEWYRNEESRQFIEQQVFPELQKRGISRIEYAHGSKPDMIQFGLTGRSFEGQSFKGGTKATQSVIEPSRIGIFDRIQNGNQTEASMVKRIDLDAVMAVKGANQLMNMAFAGSDKEIQQKILFRVAGNKPTIWNAIRGYYSGLGDNPAALDELAGVMGRRGGMPLLEEMSNKIIGARHIITESGEIDERVATQQQKQIDELGVGRAVGFAPIGAFTAKTRNQFKDTFIRQAMREQGVDRNQALLKFRQNFSFEEDKAWQGEGKFYTGFQRSEFIVANQAAVNPVMEYSGLGREKFGRIGQALTGLGLSSLSEFRHINAPTRSVIQKALMDFGSAYSSTAQGRPTATGRYIHIGDFATDADALRLNRNDLSSLLSGFGTENSSSAAVLENLRQTLKDKFGEGDFGLDFMNERRVVLPSISAMLNSEKLTKQISGDTIEEVSLSRTSSKMVGVMNDLAVGTKEEAMDALGRYKDVGRKLLGSDNLLERVYGVHKKYGVSPLLEPSQIYVGPDTQASMFRISGGDRYNSSEFNEYIKMWAQKTYGTIVRDPVTVGSSGRGRAGSVVPVEVLTKDNSTVGKYIYEKQRASGLMTQDIQLSPFLASQQGDADADAVIFEAALAIAGKTGDTKKTMAKFYDPESSNTPLMSMKGFMGMQSPEFQEETMGLLFKGVKGADIAKNPQIANIVNTIKGIYGKGAETIFDKTMASDGTSWREINRIANYQKNQAMGGTHNQLIRRITAGAVMTGLQPNVADIAKTLIGAKFSQQAIDQEFTPKSIVSFLQGGFVSSNKTGTGLRIGFNESRAMGPSDAEWSTPVNWNKDTGLSNAIVQVMKNITAKDKELTPLDVAYLIGQPSSDPSLMTKKALSHEEAYTLGVRQNQFYEGLARRLEPALKGTSFESTEIFNTLQNEGLIGDKSIFGEAALSRLSENYEGNLFSPSKEKNAKAEKVKAAAKFAGIDVEGIFSERGASTSAFYKMLVDKITPGHGGFKTMLNPINFATEAMRWAKFGLQNNEIVRSAMDTFGQIHGLQFNKGTGVLETLDTQQAINSNESLKNWSKDFQVQGGRDDKPTREGNVSRRAPTLMGLHKKVNLDINAAKAQGATEEQINKIVDSGILAYKQEGYSDEEIGTIFSTHRPNYVDQAVARGGTPPVAVAGGAGATGGNGTNIPVATVPASPVGNTGGRARGSGVVRYGNQYLDASDVSYLTQNFIQSATRALGYSGTHTPFENLNQIGNANQNTPDYMMLGGLVDANGNTASPLTRAQALLKGDYSREVKGYLRGGSPEGIEIMQLRKHKRMAGAVLDSLPEGSIVKDYAAALLGDQDALTRLPQHVRDVIPFSSTEAIDLGSAKYDGYTLGQQGAYLNENERRLNTITSGVANQRYGTMSTKNRALSDQLAYSVAQERRLQEQLRPAEDLLPLSENRKIANLDPNSPTFLADLQARKTGLVGLENFEKSFKGTIEDIEGQHGKSVGMREELEGPTGLKLDKLYSKVGLVRSSAESFGLIEIEKFNEKLKESTGIMGKVNDLFTKHSKQLELDTKILEKRIDADRGAKGMMERFAEKEFGVGAIDKETGLSYKQLQGIKARFGDKGKDFVEGYESVRGDILKAETAEEGLVSTSGLTHRISRGARQIFSGFGLMYMRSILGIMTGAGNLGYEESIQRETAVAQALSGGIGANALRNTQADSLAGAKAQYAGGGKRSLLAFQEQMYRNHPNLMNMINNTVSGIAAFGATTWAAEALGSAFLGSAAIPFGLAVGVGSAFATQIGRASDEASWIGANYSRFSQIADNGRANGAWSYQGGQLWTSGMGQDIISKGLYNATQLTGVGANSNFARNMSENVRLSILAKEADTAVATGKAKTRKEALTKAGVTKDDQNRLENMWAVQWVNSENAGASTQGRLAAIQGYETLGGRVDQARISTLEKAARIADAGYDLAGLSQTFLNAGGFQYSADRVSMYTGLAEAYPTMNQVDYTRLTTLGQIATQMGAPWTRANLGKTIEEVVAGLTPPAQNIETTVRQETQEETRARVAKIDEERKIWDLAKRKGVSYEKAKENLSTPDKLTYRDYSRKDQITSEAGRLKFIEQNKFSVYRQPLDITTIGQSAAPVSPERQAQYDREMAMTNAVAAGNAPATMAYITAQNTLAQYGAIPSSKVSLPAVFGEKLTEEESARLENTASVYQRLTERLKLTEQKYGRSDPAMKSMLRGFSERMGNLDITRDKTLQADMARVDRMISGESPLALAQGIYGMVTGKDIGQQKFAREWLEDGKTAPGGQFIPNWQTINVGVDAQTGAPTGGPWGQYSFNRLGFTNTTNPILQPQSGFNWARSVWGNDWFAKAQQINPQYAQMLNQATGGQFSKGTNGLWSSQGVTSVLDPNGPGYQGQAGIQMLRSNMGYQSQMAQAGIQMAQLNLSYAFTTGIGLDKYAGTTINPQTGQPFNINPNGGGFWGIEDRQRALGYAQQEWSFGMQQRQMNMQNRFWTENRALNMTQVQLQRGWTRQDWAYQENTRDLQWQWKQEDYNENVRFMTGRDRRLAERQMGRDTTMYDMEGNRIETQKKRQQELWKLEDTRFALEKRQHNEQLKLQQEELAMQKKFFNERRELEEEQIELQRAYWVEQQALQRASIGVQTAYATAMKDLDDKMIASGSYTDALSNNLGLANELFPEFNGNVAALITQMLRLVKKEGAGTVNGGTGEGGGEAPDVNPNNPTGSGMVNVDSMLSEMYRTTRKPDGMTVINRGGSRNGVSTKQAITVEIEGHQFSAYITGLVDKSLR